VCCRQRQITNLIALEDGLENANGLVVGHEDDGLVVDWQLLDQLGNHLELLAIVLSGLLNVIRAKVRESNQCLLMHRRPATWPNT
jgi:hypothetical protein